MGMLSSFLHPGRAFGKAQEQMENYYNQGQQAISPYMQQGQSAYAPLSGAMTSLLSPSDLQNEWAQGYETSPYAQMLMEQAKTQGLDAASSMGLMGSTPALQAIQAGQSMIGAADRDNFMRNNLNMYLQGAGLAQNLYGTGANAASQYGQNAMNMGNNAAEMAYGRAAAPGNMLGNMIGLAVGTAFPWAHNAWNTTGGNNSMMGPSGGGAGASGGGMRSPTWGGNY